MPRLSAVSVCLTSALAALVCAPSAAASVSLRLATPDIVDHAYAGISPSGAAIFFTSHDPTPLDSAPGLDLYADRVTGTERIAGTSDMSATAHRISYRESSADGSVVAYFLEDAVPGPTITITPYLRTPDLRRPLIPGGAATGPPGGILAVSPDGRRRLFSTEAALVTGDADSTSDVYVDDDASGLHLMTPNTPGPVGVSTVCGHSEDLGRVVFATGDAVDPGDTNGLEDIYETSVAGEIVRRTALPLGGFPGAFCRATSTDLAAIVFSTGGRLVPEDTDSEEDVYLQSTAGLTRIARDPDGFEDVSVSQDGTIVTFETATGYSVGDNNGTRDPYQWRDGTLRRIATTIVSADHRSTFTITDRRLSPADTDEAVDLYMVRDGQRTELLTRGMTGERSFDVHGISPDGRRLLFSTRGRITADDQDGGVDIYLGGDGVRLLSGAGNDHAIFRGASVDLSTVAFSTASPLVSSDVDEAEDLYRATFTPPPAVAPPPVPAIPAPAAPGSGNTAGRDTAPLARPTVSAGRRVALTTLARRGLRVSVTTSAPARIDARLRVTSAVRRRLGLKSAVLKTTRSARRTGRRTVVIKIPKATRARLARQRRTIAATLEVRAIGPAGTKPAITRRSVRITTR